MRPGDGVPPLAQLKVLRAEQLEVNEQTKEFAKNHPNLNNLNEAQQRELTALELPLRVAAREGRQVESQVTILRRDGRKVDIWGFATPLFDETGLPRGSMPSPSWHAGTSRVTRRRTSGTSRSGRGCRCVTHVPVSRQSQPTLPLGCISARRAAAGEWVSLTVTAES